MRSRISSVIRSVSVLGVVSSAAWAQQPLGTGIIYQGLLKQSGQPYNGPANLVFDLYDAPTGGSPVGPSQSLIGWPVADGLFTVQLNGGGEFGPRAFNGEARWLEITADNQPLTPRQPILAAPYALHLPHGTMVVVNVQDYGADGTCDCSGGCHDAEAVQAAIAAIPAGGGVLYFPRGTYCLPARCAELKSNMLMIGDGAASRIIKRRLPVNNDAIFVAAGQDGIRITNLAFDMNHDNDFEQIVRFDVDPDTSQPCSNIRIDSCHFYTSGALSEPLTLQAIDAARVSGLFIVGNRFDSVQARTALDVGAGPTGSGPGTFVLGNYFVRPHNYAVSCVNFAPEARISDVLIADNVIVDPVSGGGIYVGSDGDDFRIAECKRVMIRNNLISGSFGTNGFGIVVRIGADSSDITICGNVVNSTGPAVPGTQGIAVRHPNAAIGSSTLRSLTVSNNQVRNFPNPGIWIYGPVSGFLVAGNQLEATEGIRIEGNDAGVPRDGIVTSNLAEGSGSGLMLQATSGNVGPILVRDNVFKNQTGGNSAGIWLLADEIHKIDADFIGNRCCDDRPAGARTQRFGIAHSATGTFDTRYLDNDLRNNAEAGMLDTPANAVVRSNAGWVTENHGQGAIGELSTSTVVAHGLSVTPPVGAISITPMNKLARPRGQDTIPAALDHKVVEHGLPAAPDPESIGITPLNNPGNDPGLIWVEAVSGTSFTVRCAAPVAGPLNFGWRIVDVDSSHIWVSDVNDTTFTVRCTNPPWSGQQLEFGWRIVLGQN